VIAVRRVAPLVGAVLLSAACTTGTSTEELNVLAPSSLTESFTHLRTLFEKANSGVAVRFEFESSTNLTRKVIEGAPADVIATADEKSMRAVVDAGKVRPARPVVVARNQLEIVVPAGNPKGITRLSDLGRADVTYVLCASQVPCGNLGSRLLTKAGVTDPQPVSLEENVKAALTKVVLGEADAGLVYTTDVRAAGSAVSGVPIESAAQPDVEAVYPIAVLEGSSQPAAAGSWVDLVRSAEGQAVLARFGFLPP
jgi:molybdate transport system substrate-binding protein